MSSPPAFSASRFECVGTATEIGPYRYLRWCFQKFPLAAIVDDYDALLQCKMPADLRC